MNKYISFIYYVSILLILLVGTSDLLIAQDLSGNKVCIFEIGQGSPYSGKYTVKAYEDEAYAYNDTENDQFVIEMHSDNFIDMMLIIENLSEGEHPFNMEYQVSIDISKDEGENYVTFHNRYENKAGHIKIEEIDKEKGLIKGSFYGLFLDDTAEVTVNLKGKFVVKME